VSLTRAALPKGSGPLNVLRAFEALFGGSAASFWLDSSAPGPAQGRRDPTPPLSFFGCADGWAGGRAGATATRAATASKVIEYYGGDRVVERYPNGTTHRVRRNVFSYLNAALSDAAANDDEIVHDDDYHQHQHEHQHQQYDAAGLDGSRRPPPPFNVTRALFGYLGYEARHEAAAILADPSRGAAEPFHLDTATPPDEAGRWGRRLAHPTALFLAPAEYVVYDHRDDTVYVVASASDREDSDSDRGGDGGSEGAAGRAKAAGRALMAQILALHAAAATTAAHAPAPGPTPLPPLNTTLRALRSRGRYRRDIQTCLEQIAAGETYEVCLTLQVP